MNTMNAKFFYEVKRETSKYNKYMKWKVSFLREDKTQVSSLWYKTQKEALNSIELAKYNGQKGFPIGNKIYFTDYLPVEAEK